MTKRIRWKLPFRSEQMENKYLVEEIVNADTRRAAHQRKAELNFAGHSESKINIKCDRISR